MTAIRESSPAISKSTAVIDNHGHISGDGGSVWPQFKAAGEVTVAHSPTGSHFQTVLINIETQNIQLFDETNPSGTLAAGSYEHSIAPTPGPDVPAYTSVVSFTPP
jgi:hypothetical protein